MNSIEVSHLTQDYGYGRGIRDVSFTVKKGEVLGFLGPNGAGKSTTMRHLMGFSKPQSGVARIRGLSCWQDHGMIMGFTGYIPGEVSIPEGLNGRGFLKMMGNMKEGRSLKKDRMEELLQLFQLNPDVSVKRMSVGEKRKLAIVAAFMNDPDILLLDEPTSGLDPVMQEHFIRFVEQKKSEGKTILLSSHIFSEVEALCDRIAIIKEGKIVSVIDAEDVSRIRQKTFTVTFADRAGYLAFRGEGFDIRSFSPETNTVTVALEEGRSDFFIKSVIRYRLKSLKEEQQTLEDYFMHFYRQKKPFSGLAATA